jgi:hypothetical protein
MLEDPVKALYRKCGPILRPVMDRGAVFMERSRGSTSLSLALCTRRPRSWHGSCLEQVQDAFAALGVSMGRLAALGGA